MDGPSAPKNYTPEHCNWVQASLINNLQSAIDTLTLVSNGQEELTTQTVKDLAKSLTEIKRDIEDLQGQTITLRFWIYSGVVSGLILFISGLFKIFSLLKGIPIK